MGQIQPVINLPLGVRVSLPKTKVQYQDQTGNGNSSVNLYVSELGISRGLSDISVPFACAQRAVIDGENYKEIMLVSGTGVLFTFDFPDSSYHRKLLKNFSQSDYTVLDESIAAGTGATNILVATKGTQFLSVYYDFDISESSLGTSPMDAYIALYFNNVIVVKKTAGINGFPRIGVYDFPVGLGANGAGITVQYANGDSVAHNFHIVTYLIVGLV